MIPRETLKETKKVEPKKSVIEIKTVYSLI